jgi:cbb3-type cytochrome oxidase maturation protein
MESVYILVPLAGVLALGTVAALVWAVRSGQFEDLEGPAHRILLDDDAPGPPRPPSGARSAISDPPPPVRRAEATSEISSKGGS